jgi:hypothetical protein
MTKRPLQLLLSLALLLLFGFQSKGQTYLVSQTEILGDYDGESYRFQTDLKGYMIVRTDEQGSLVWMSTMKTFGSDSSYFCQNESRFIVAGLTGFNKRNNRIKGRPSDYEYWLVPFDEVSPGFYCLPNPTKGPVKIVIDENSQIRKFFIYDVMCRVVETIETEGTDDIEIDLGKYSDGTLLIQGMDSKGTSVQTIKIIKK